MKSSNTLGTAIAFYLFLAPSHLQADVTFNDFNTSGGIDLDAVGIGGSKTLTDGLLGNVTLETVDLKGQNGLLTSSGDPDTANETNSTSNDLGVNSEDNVGGYGSQSRDFNPGEAWTFKFDVDVTLETIRFAGYGAGAQMTVSSTALASPIDITSGDPIDLLSTTLTAGTEVTLEMTSDDGTEEEPNDTGMRLDYLTVAVVPVAPTGANLKYTGVGGNDWNTTPANTNWADTDNADAPIAFTTDDNVTIDIPGVINVDAGGITAGALTDATASGTVTLQTGDLTSTSLTKSGASTLLIDSPVTFDSGVLIDLSGGGTLQVNSGAALSTGLLSLSGESTLQTEEPITFGSITNSVLDNPFTKSGAGNITINGPIGTQTTGTVALNILGGSITATGNNQLNISGASIFDGDFILEGASIEFHGNTTTGTGSIIAQSGNATIDSRFNGGPVNVANGIILNSDLIIEAPTGNSEMMLNGAISGVGNLVKDGNGLIILTGTNTYTGTTTIDSGVLRIGSGPGSTSGNLGTGAVTIDETSSVGNLEFRRDDAISVPNMISGVGNIRQQGGPASSTTLTALNDYTGVTSVRGGTLVATTIADYEVPCSIGAAPIPVGPDFPTQLLLRDGGILSYTGPAASTDREFTLGSDGGTISSDGTGPLNFNSPFEIAVDGTGTETRVLTLSGSATGVNNMSVIIIDGTNAMHALTKTGTTTWSLTGVNTYTGPTTVEEGVLSLGNDFLADASDISIDPLDTGSATLDLPHGATDTVGSLTVGGVAMPIGIYGAVGSADPTDIEIAEITGTGRLNVTSLPGTDYDTWASDFSLVGGMDDDDDNDGLSNKDEYAFGLDPTSGASVSPIPTPVDQATGIFTYTRRNSTVYNTELTYSYGSSTTLQGDFTPFTPVSEVSDDGDPVETITVTLPAALLTNPTLFVQVTAE